MPGLHLDDVTVCAADCLNPELAARALRISTQRCGFADAILFCHRPVEGPFRCIEVPEIKSHHDYSRFVLQDLHRFIATPFVLIIQWDGYVLDPGAWTPQFRDFDYIGARWPEMPEPNVGNGGFSLRSQRLLTAVAQTAHRRFAQEDLAICQAWRPTLEQTYKLTFAPSALADRFSYERSTPDRPTFGFHGLFNMWRHMDDAEMIALAGAVSTRSLFGRDYVECAVEYYRQRKFAPLAALYARWRLVMTTDQIAVLVAGVTKDKVLAADVVRIAKGLARRSDADREVSGLAG